MPLVDILDETFVVAAPEQLAAHVHDPHRWQQCWPQLTLTVYRDRGAKGVQWTVTGELVGSSEIWLEPVGDGVVVHYFLRADPVRPRSPRALDRLRRRLTLAWKAQVHALKDELEAGRRPGEPRAAEGCRREHSGG